MQRTDIGTGLGIGQQMVKYTLAYTDFNTATSSSTYTIALATDPGGNAVQVPGTAYGSTNAANFLVPQAGWVYYAKIHQTSQFVGSGTVTLAIGKVGSATNFVAPAFTISNAAADTTLQETFSVPSGQITPWGVSVTLVAGTSGLQNVVQGQVDVYLGYMNVSSPSE